MPVEDRFGSSVRGLLAGLIAGGAACSSDPQPAASPDAGSSTSVLAEKMIDGAGGELAAGGVRITIPAGALSASTRIAIARAPSTVTAPMGTNAIGAAFRFEPEG